MKIKDSNYSSPGCEIIELKCEYSILNNSFDDLGGGDDNGMEEGGEI